MLNYGDINLFFLFKNEFYSIGDSYVYCILRYDWVKKWKFIFRICFWKFVCLLRNIICKWEKKEFYGKVRDMMKINIIFLFF